MGTLIGWLRAAWRAFKRLGEIAYGPDSDDDEPETAEEWSYRQW